MIMSLRSANGGKIHHTLSAGAIVGAGDLLATLDLADPSKALRMGARARASDTCSFGCVWGASSPEVLSPLARKAIWFDIGCVPGVSSCGSLWDANYEDSPWLGYSILLP